MRTWCVAVVIAVGLLGCGFVGVGAPAEEMNEDTQEFGLGIGTKLLDGLPFAVITARIGSVGAEGSLSFIPMMLEGHAVSVVIYSLLGRYYVEIPKIEMLQLYGGGGFLGMHMMGDVSTNGTTMPISVTVSGFEASGGVEANIGPVSVFGGFSWLGFLEATIEGVGVEKTEPVGIAGSCYHWGVRYEF